MYIPKKVTTIKKKTLLIIFLVPIIYSISYFLVKKNISGDQILYRNSYEKLQYMNMLEAIQSSKWLFNSFELISTLILWFGASTGFPKDFYVSLLNLALILSLFFFLNKYKTPWYIYIFAFTNFYLFALLTTLDRLKIAYFFLLLIPLFPKNKYFLGSISPLAHLQSFIFFLPYLTIKVLKSIYKFLIKLNFKKGTLTLILFSIPIILLAFTFLKVPILDKFNAYFDSRIKIWDSKNLFLLSFIWLYLSRFKINTIITILILFVLVIILGSVRMNMVIFTLFFYQGILNRYYRNIFFNMVLFYFSIKSILFIYNLFKYGDGYLGYLF